MGAARSPYTRDFEDVVAWLAQQMAKTPIAGLLRIGWDSVGRIVQRVMADHLDERRLDGLVAIGVDEISYRRGQRYLTSVADHPTGAIVWCAPGRNSATLQAFFDELGERRHSIRAVSIDMSGEYQRAIRAAIPQAEICFDPFHVCRLAQPRDRPGPPRRVERPRALAHRDRPLGQGHPLVAAQSARTPDPRPAGHPRRGPTGQHPALPRLPAARRAQAALPPRRPTPRARAPRRLAGLGLPLPARPVRQARAHPPAHRDGILAAIRLGLSNGRLEGLNSKIRLISHRSFGFHSAARPHRPRLPLLHRHRHRAPSMNFTPKSTGAPTMGRGTEPTQNNMTYLGSRARPN